MDKINKLISVSGKLTAILNGYNVKYGNRYRISG